MREVYELDVYRLAEELSDMIWTDFDHWCEKAQRTVGYQIIRSADSIAANLAEGYGRYSPKDKANFYRYSRGSFEETKCWLRKASRRNLITKDKVEVYKNIIDELGPKLNGFIRSTLKAVP
ncbi:four helix bundle protein [Pontiellaceae bacterium B12227]|nr:four helix bundle protein [Pontiellaceae bacterium B12227]